MTKEWENEPDKLFWTDEETGYNCAILRHHTFKHLCGYVRIPKDHPLFNLEYSDKIPSALKYKFDEILKCKIGKRSPVSCLFTDIKNPHVEILFDVHWGLTFSEYCDGEYLPEGFWYGFDCSHAGDMSPYRFENQYSFPSEIYRNIEYVKNECKSLAKQLKELESKDA